MANIRRLRRCKTKFTFGELAEHQRIVPKSPRAIALATAIGQLRKAEELPLPEDQLVEFWGNESCWAHYCAESLWLYYKVEVNPDEEVVVLIAVYDHLHEM